MAKKMNWFLIRIAVATAQETSRWLGQAKDELYPSGYQANSIALHWDKPKAAEIQFHLNSPATSLNTTSLAILLLYEKKKKKRITENINKQ